MKRITKKFIAIILVFLQITCLYAAFPKVSIAYAADDDTDYISAGLDTATTLGIDSGDEVFPKMVGFFGQAYSAVNAIDGIYMIYNNEYEEGTCKIVETGRDFVIGITPISKLYAAANIMVKVVDGKVSAYSDKYIEDAYQSFLLKRQKAISSKIVSMKYKDIVEWINNSKTDFDTVIQEQLEKGTDKGTNQQILDKGLDYSVGHKYRKILREDLSKDMKQTEKIRGKYSNRYSQVVNDSFTSKQLFDRMYLDFKLRLSADGIEYIINRKKAEIGPIIEAFFTIQGKIVDKEGKPVKVNNVNIFPKDDEYSSNRFTPGVASDGNFSVVCKFSELDNYFNGNKVYEVHVPMKDGTTIKIGAFTLQEILKKSQKDILKGSRIYDMGELSLWGVKDVQGEINLRGAQSQTQIDIHSKFKQRENNILKSEILPDVSAVVFNIKDGDRNINILKPMMLKDLNGDSFKFDLDISPKASTSGGVNEIAQNLQLYMNYSIGQDELEKSVKKIYDTANPQVKKSMDSSSYLNQMWTQYNNFRAEKSKYAQAKMDKISSGLSSIFENQNELFERNFNGEIEIPSLFDIENKRISTCESKIEPAINEINTYKQNLDNLINQEDEFTNIKKEYSDFLGELSNYVFANIYNNHTRVDVINSDIETGNKLISLAKIKKQECESTLEQLNILKKFINESKETQKVSIEEIKKEFGAYKNFEDNEYAKYLEQSYDKKEEEGSKIFAEFATALADYMEPETGNMGDRIRETSALVETKSNVLKYYLKVGAIKELPKDEGYATSLAVKASPEVLLPELKLIIDNSWFYWDILNKNTEMRNKKNTHDEIYKNILQKYPEDKRNSVSFQPKNKNIIEPSIFYVLPSVIPREGIGYPYTKDVFFEVMDRLLEVYKGGKWDEKSATVFRTEKLKSEEINKDLNEPAKKKVNYLEGRKPISETTKYKKFKYKDFQEIKNSDYDYYVKRLLDYGIVSADKNNKFNVKAQITKGEFIRMLSIASGFDMAKLKFKSQSFKDVNSKNPYYSYIEACVKYGIIEVSNYKNKTFLPNSPLTLKEEIEFMVNAMGLQEVAKEKESLTTYYSNEKQIPQKLKGYINAISKEYLIPNLNTLDFDGNAKVIKGSASFTIYYYIFQLPIRLRENTGI